MRKLLVLGILVAALAGCTDGHRSAGAPLGHPASRGLASDPDDVLVIARGHGRHGGATPSSAEVGRLEVRRDGRPEPLPLKHTEVKAKVSLAVASVSVVQQYHNPYAEKIEVVYTFPLPDDASVRDFVLQIGERRIRGLLREKEEATKIYEEAKRQGYRASLMVQDRPNIFTQSVANIEPGKQIDVAVTYFHSVRVEDGGFELVIPTVVGPRFNPPGSTGGVGAVPHGGAPSGQARDVAYLRPEVVPTNEISIDVDLEAGGRIEELSSPSHALKVERPAPTRATVSLAPADRVPNKDFVLRWRAAGPEIRGAFASHADEQGSTFLVLLQPPAELSAAQAPPREIVLVIDHSGSMQGEPLDIAKRAAIRALHRLRPKDTFRILWFSDRVRSMSNEPLGADAANVAAGVRAIERIQAEGGTMFAGPVIEALGTPHEEGRLRIVAFFTDGFIGNEAEILGEVSRRLGPSRIFSFGIGSSVNRYLLESMARIGKGASAYVGLDEGTARAVDATFERLEHPAMTDLRVDWGGLQVSDVYPATIPDLLVGRPVVLAGRAAGRGRSTITASGLVAGRRVSIPIEVDLGASEHPAIPPIWARRRLADLQDRLVASDSPAALLEELKAVSLKYGVLCELTAFVAVDASERTEGSHGTTVTQPVPMPKGVRYETTVPEKPVEKPKRD